jgi:adenylate cyclase
MRFPFKSFFSVNPASISIGAVLLVLFLFLAGIPILDMIELKTYDLRFLSRGPLRPSPTVVMALIDEKSLDQEGRWPWPRSKLARLVDALSQDGAKVIAFDIAFVEPDENSELQFISRLGEKIGELGIRDYKLAAFLNESRNQADNDLALARAIRNNAAAVVLGYFFHMSETDLDHKIEKGEIDKHLDRISSSKYPLVVYDDPDMKISPFIQAHAPAANLEILTDSSASQGYFSVAADHDGVIRWMPLIIQCGEHIFPHLVVSSASLYLDSLQPLVKVARYGVRGIQIGERFLPTDEHGQLLINYLGPPKTFPHYSITDIINGKLPKDTFKDKLVLIGATAMGTHDLRSTPFSPLYPGVEIHATVIDNILTQHFLTKPKWSVVYDLLAIILLGLVTGIALRHTGAMKGAFLAAGLFTLHILVAQRLFVNSGVWLNIVYPLAAIIITYTSLTLYHYATEERERKKIKGAFRHYVSPIVIDEILKDPGRLKLGGEEKVITVLFSDMAGFSGYSERYSPQEMISILSEYFAEMTDQVFAFQGTLKEYVGDELMAIFGAPLDQADHAERACAAALAMRDRLHTLRLEWAAMGRPPVSARTGINSGRMLVGNIGSRYRFSYGALGDQVNLGSRLEGLNKMYGTEILLGENTAPLVDKSFLLRELDMVRVVGRKQPVRVYELVGNIDDSLPEHKVNSLKHFAEGLEAYRRQLWEEALARFNESLALFPQDGPSRVMAERCRIYKEACPPADWDCVFEHTSKGK